MHRRASLADARQIPARRQGRLLGPTGIDVRLLDQHEPDPVTPKTLDFRLGIRKPRRVEGEGTHVRRTVEDASVPLQIERESVHREVIRAQCAELVLELCPVVEPELGDPEAEHLPRRHPWTTDERHVTPAQPGRLGSAQQIAANYISAHRYAPGVARQVPRLCVEGIEKQDITPARTIQGVQDRELRVLGETTVEGWEVVPELVAGADDPPEEVTVRLAGVKEVLPQTVEMTGPALGYRQDVVVPADRLGAKCREGGGGRPSQICHPEAKRAVDPEP